MKSLFAVLLLAIAAGVGYWKTQHPDASIDDIRGGAETGIARLKGGFDAIKEGSVDTGNSAESITARLDSMQAQLSESQNSSGAAVVNGRLTDAERRLRAQDQRVDTIQSNLESVLSNVQSLNDTENPSTEQLNSLENQLALLNRRVEEQSTQFEAVSIDEKLTQLNSQLSSMEESQRENRVAQETEIGRLDEKIQSVEARLNTLSTDTSSGLETAAATVNAQIDQRLALLENKLDTTTTDSKRLSALTEQLSNSREKMALLESRYSETSGEIDKLNASIAELQTRNESISIDDLQTQLSTQIGALQRQIDNNDSNTNEQALNDAIEATRSRIQSLEQRVTDLPASSNEASDAVKAQSDLEAQIASLEQRLASVNTAPDPALAESISEVNERVSELASKSYLTLEDLQEQQASKNVEYKIYFERNSTSITEDAGKVLNSFIAQEKNRTVGVSIYGFTDRRGSATYNQQLALQRATNVRSYLIQNGFSFTKIRSVTGLGEDAAAALQPDGEEDAGQRTVVLFAAQP